MTLHGATSCSSLLRRRRPRALAPSHRLVTRAVTLQYAPQPAVHLALGKSAVANLYLCAVARRRQRRPQEVRSTSRTH